MKFTVKTQEQTSDVYSDSWLINKYSVDKLVGKSCQIIEIIGLSNKQEEAVKGAIKSEIYKCFSQSGGALYVENELSGALWCLDEKERRHSAVKGGLMERGQYEITKIVKEA